MAIFWNHEEGRLRAPWRLLLQLTLYSVFLSFLFLPVTMGVAGVVLAADGPVGADPDSSSFRLVVSAAALLATFLSVGVAGRFLDRRPFEDFGFRLSRMWFSDLGFGFVLGAVLMAGIFVIEWALGWVRVDGAFETAGSGPFVVAFMVPLAIFVCVGIYEELLFRGYQLKNLAEGLNSSAIGPKGATLLSWALTSAYFGVRHAENPNATPMSILNIALGAGLMLGIGYVLTGELAIPIGLHIGWNLFQSNVFGFPVSGLSLGGAKFLTLEQGGPVLWTGGSFGPEAGLLGLCAMLTGASLIALWVRVSRGKVAWRQDRIAWRGTTPADARRGERSYLGKGPTTGGRP